MVVTTINRNLSALDITKLMIKNKVGSVVLVDGDGRPAEIVAERDLLKKVSASNKPAKKTMSSPVITIPAYDSIETAAAVMAKSKVNRLVVIGRMGLWQEFCQPPTLQESWQLYLQTTIAATAT